MMYLISFLCFNLKTLTLHTAAVELEVKFQVTASLNKHET